MIGVVAEGETVAGGTTCVPTVGTDGVVGGSGKIELTTPVSPT